MSSRAPCLSLVHRTRACSLPGTLVRGAACGLQTSLVPVPQVTGVTDTCTRLDGAELLKSTCPKTGCRRRDGPVALEAWRCLRRDLAVRRTGTCSLDSCPEAGFGYERNRLWPVPSGLPTELQESVSAFRCHPSPDLCPTTGRARRRMRGMACETDNPPPARARTKSPRAQARSMRRLIGSGGSSGSPSRSFVATRDDLNSIAAGFYTVNPYSRCNGQAVRKVDERPPSASAWLAARAPSRPRSRGRKRGDGARAHRSPRPARGVLRKNSKSPSGPLLGQNESA